MSAPTDDPGPGHGFAKSDRLLRRAQFLNAQDRGRRVHTTHFVVVLFDRGDDAGARLGVTASRKSAKSVGRNRTRRLIREVFRTHKARFPAAHDCVVILREKVPVLALADVRDELLGALARPVRRGPPGAKPPRDAKQAVPGAPPPPRERPPRR